jgi:glucose/arabinose dehydrogenase
MPFITSWAQKLSKADESEGNMKSTMARILVAASLGLCLGANAAFAEEAKTRSTKLDDDKAASRANYTVFATGLAEPRGLLVAPSGDLYVAEQKSGSIAKITPDGKITRIADGFVSPHDLAIDAKGNIYVAETATGRVAMISPTGKVTTYLADLDGPVDLDFNPHGELLVCELQSGKVRAFQSPNKYRTVVTLVGPHGLAFKTGDTFVNDWKGDKVVKVSPQGRVQVIANVKGPVGLAFGRSGDLYVAQPQARMVSRIKPDGTRLVFIENLAEPRDPVFDSAGNLFLAETAAGRILKFSGDF